MRNILLGTFVCAVLLGTTFALITQRPKPTSEQPEFDRVELRLNDFTPSGQSQVALDVNEDGQALVVWESRRQQSGTYGVYARSVSADGTLLGPETRINVHELSMQRSPAVAWTDRDAPMVAWTSLGQDGSGAGIIARSTGDEHLVPETTAGPQSQVALAGFGDGRVIAVWISADETGRQTVRGRILDRAGRGLGDELAISTSSGGTRDRLPAVAASGDRFAVAWDRFQSDGEIKGIFARCFDRHGEPATDEFRVSDGDVDEIEPTLAMDERGHFVVGWMRLDPTTDYDPFVRRFDESGRPLGDPAPVCADRAGWQSGLALGMNQAGEWVAAWTAYEDDSSDVMARLFAADGSARTGDFIATEHREGRQAMSGAGAKRVALLDDGTIAVGWQGDSGRGDASGANLTLLRPADNSIFARARRALQPQTTSPPPIEHPSFGGFDAAASPIQPPVFDPATIPGILDPESFRVGEDGDIGFVGITATGWDPPDPHMSVGLNHVILCTNGAVAAYTKDGTQLWQEPIEGSGGFWGEVGAGGFVFDPEAHFDPYENRYYAMANERTSGRSYFLLGISSSEDAGGTWHKYRFDVTSVGGNDIDSPNLGFDESAIYLTADFFSPDKYMIFMIDKPSVIDGGTAITNSYLRTGTQSMGLPAQYTSEAPRMYLLEHFDGSNRTELRLWSINDPFGSPSISSTTVDVDPYWPPGNSRSRGTSVQVILFEPRFWSCMYINGSIWACHHIRSASGSTAKVRWYEIEMNGWPNSLNLPTVAQQGTVDEGSSIYHTFNSISADADGNAYMIYAKSSANDYYSISRTLHLAGDEPGVMGEPQVLKQSNSPFSSNRWGDYSSVNFDPAEPGRFWSHHEYTPGGNQWSTWVQSEALPIDPASVSPAVEAGIGPIEAFPNPSIASATLRFTLARAGEVRVAIFGADGREIRSLRQGRLEAGPQQIEWDGETSRGRLAPTGVYLARVTVDGVPVAGGRLIRAR